MRSRLLSLADPCGLINGPIRESLPIEEVYDNVERDLQTLCMEHKETVPVSRVENGDTAVLNLCSKAPKYNRKGLWLRVGANLFDADLEKSLPGRKTGSSYMMTIGNTTVEISLEKCLRTRIPEPSDAFIESLGMEEIKTLAQYRAHSADYHKAQFREYYLEYLVSVYTEQWFDASQWYLDGEELEAFWQAARNQHQRECEAHDTFFMESYPGQLEEMLREEALRYLQSLLVDCLLSGGDPETVVPDLDHGYARKAVMDRVWGHMAKHLDPHFELCWEES